MKGSWRIRNVKERGRQKEHKREKVKECEKAREGGSKKANELESRS